MNIKSLNTEFTRFIFVGVINTLSYYSIYLVLHNLFSLPYLLAHIVGFLISLNISFFLNCYVTYRIRPTWKKYFYFPLTQVVNMSVSTALIFYFRGIFETEQQYRSFCGSFVYSSDYVYRFKQNIKRSGATEITKRR